ncbi:MAG: DivIVA domain-containing protein [Oscillospiraceae bacterium]|jgi:cell division initiation protein|nr:DivIVA domain-containing protein [Oscillospiraceae bacterium]
MLTPQNFREKTFEKAIFGGYDMGAVDDFLDEAANDYAAVAKENMVLKSKMKVLVDKIEEYRATEESMRLTLLSAQKLSMQIEADARKKAEELLADARGDAERITREAYSQRTAEESLLLGAKRESTQYIENMRLICAKQLDFLNGLRGLKREALSRPDPPKEQLDDTVRSIESSVERLSDTGGAAEEIRRVVTAGPEGPASSFEEPTKLFGAGASSAGPAGQFSFDNLRFGK